MTDERLPEFKLLAREPAPVVEVPVMSPDVAADVRALILATPEFRGEEGATGTQGEQGSRGEPGRRGRRGEMGFPGTDGGTGIEGRQGETGAQGTPGERGPRGPRGAKGLKGDTGLAPAHEFSRTSLRFRKPDGTWGEFVDLRGPQGAGGGGGRRTSTTAITDASLVGSDLVLVRDGLGLNITVDLSSLVPTQRVGITVETPRTVDNFTVFFTSVAITIQQINFVLQGSTDVTVFVNFDSDRSVAGTSVISAGTVVSNTTTGQEITSFDNAAIPADSWVWVEFTAVTGNPDEVNVSLVYI